MENAFAAALDSSVYVVKTAFVTLDMTLGRTKKKEIGNSIQSVPPFSHTSEKASLPLPRTPTLGGTPSKAISVEASFHPQIWIHHHPASPSF